MSAPTFQDLALSQRPLVQFPNNWEELHQSLAALQAWVASVTVPNVQPYARLRVSASDLTIHDNSGTVVVWERFLGGLHSTTYDTFPNSGILRNTGGDIGATGTRIWPQSDGVYLITAQIRWAAAGATTGYRAFEMVVNGGDELAIDRKDGTTTTLTQSLTHIVQWPDPEYGYQPFYFDVTQTSGSDLDMIRSTNSGWVEIVKLF